MCFYWNTCVNNFRKKTGVNDKEGKNIEEKLWFSDAISEQNCTVTTCMYNFYRNQRKSWNLELK